VADVVLVDLVRGVTMTKIIDQLEDLPVHEHPRGDSPLSLSGPAADRVRPHLVVMDYWRNNIHVAVAIGGMPALPAIAGEYVALGD